MNIQFHKNFKKRYKKLSSKLQDKVDNAILRFRDDPFDSILKNHKLSGRMEGRRAVWVTGNVRIIFREYQDYTLVVMLDVGGHSEVYG